jgi:solute carrier family 34 (sodium-dependent phosphate cotransporter)
MNKFTGDIGSLEEPPNHQKYQVFLRIVLILLTVYLFLFSIDLMSTSLKFLGTGVAESILQATSNPFVSFFIGLLMTAMIQSSSTSTSMVVAAVASGSLSFSNGVPMIMGANIGTTITSTIVSISFIFKKNEFRRAFAAATVHDLFNIMVAIVLFPLEYNYGLLSNMAESITALLPTNDSDDVSSGFRLGAFLTGPLSNLLITLIRNEIVLLGIAFVGLFGSIKIISRLLTLLLIGKSQVNLQKIVFKNPLKSFLWGAGLTSAVQSSSITTPLIVPLVATRKITLPKTFPFIMGANIGTTITALLAALFKSDAAISIAIAHLLFNLIGVAIFLPFSRLRNIPVKLALWLGELSRVNRLVVFLYIFLVFFLIPFGLIYASKGNIETIKWVYEIEKSGKATSDVKVILRKSYKNQPTHHWVVFEGLSSDSITSQMSPTQIFDVSSRKNVLFVGDAFFIIRGEGYCWDDSGEKGKFQVCIESYQDQWSLPSIGQVDSVYHFRKTFYQEESGDSLTTHYYYGLRNKVLLRKETIQPDGTVTYRESLKKVLILP